MQFGRETAHETNWRERILATGLALGMITTALFYREAHDSNIEIGSAASVREYESLIQDGVTIGTGNGLEVVPELGLGVDCEQSYIHDNNISEYTEAIDLAPFGLSLKTRSVTDLPYRVIGELTVDPEEYGDYFLSHGWTVEFDERADKYFVYEFKTRSPKFEERPKWAQTREDYVRVDSVYKDTFTEASLEDGLTYHEGKMQLDIKRTQDRIVPVQMTLKCASEG